MSRVSDEILTTCSSEPIHIPGAIQPFGVLLAFSRASGKCTQASANCGDLLPVSAEQALGRSLGELFGDAARALEHAAALEDPASGSPLSLDSSGRRLEAQLHRHDGTLIVELEPSPEGADPSRHFRRLQGALTEMRAVDSPAALFDFVARFVADFTGYERAMVYRFDDDWHGEVVGECLLADVDSYMGLHFPASDIPEQARALYAKNWLRIIPDAGYTPVPLVPELDPESGRPLDLGKAALRSVSPVHLEYLRNMDVGASMSISLIVEGKLWGLVACHHRTPRPLAPGIRAACELFGQIASAQIESLTRVRRESRRIEAARIQTGFFDSIAREATFAEALTKYTPALLRFMQAAGAAVVTGSELTLVGTTPPQEDVEALVSWLRGQAVEPVFVTDSLGSEYPPARAFKGVASGLLALRLSRMPDEYVLWFRPEIVTTVTWAGNPEKAAHDDGILHPRKSFGAWKETVTGRSLPWEEPEIQGAHELLNAANAMLLRRTQSLSQLNKELEKKNTDLNSFAYIASHDLREPLRGISHYASFILEDHRGEMPAEAIRRLETIARLATQSEELIQTLNRFSQLGRMEIARRPVSSAQLIAQVVESLSSMAADHGAEVRVEPELPEISCDPVLMREVFSNLIANGIRYNDSPRKLVEVGRWPQGDPRGDGRVVFFVRDNGIGIAAKHHENVFRIFRRLHAPEDYGGGTGAGLAIVKSIVERHGGSIRLESEPGAGTTFFLALEP